MWTDQEKIIRTTRLILTCIIVFLVTWYYQVPERIWSLITIWFVMTEYTSVGGVYRKGFYRFAGTFLSAAYGIFVIYCFANNVVIDMIAFVIGVFVYMHYFLDSEKGYIAIIGCVTLSIVLLNHNDLNMAILRTFNIIIGILSSLFMIRFFYPRYARDEIMDEQSNFIRQLSNIIGSYLDTSRSLTEIKLDCLKYESNILLSLASFNRHLSEAKIETGNTPLFITYNQAAIEHIRHLFRLLSVFVNDLTTDEIRSDALISNPLHQLLLDLEAIHSRLGSGEAIMHCNPIPFEENILAQKGQTIQAILLILSHMHSVVNLLDIEIKKLVSIYERYYVGHKPIWVKEPQG